MIAEHTAFFASPAKKCDDVYAVERRLTIKAPYLFFSLFFVLASLAVPTLLMTDRDTLLFGILLLLFLLPLNYLLYKDLKGKFKLHHGGLYFNVTSQGIFYTRYNALSDGVSHYQLLWSEVASLLEDGTKAKIDFYYSSDRSKTRHLIIYTSNPIGETKENRIPVHEIKKFKHHWDITQAILMQIASLQRPDLVISEELYYYFNVNPATFQFQKKNLRRNLANFAGASTAIAISLGVIHGLYLFLTKIEMNFFWFTMSILFFLTVLILIIAFAVAIIDRIPFFRNSFPAYTLVAYRAEQERPSVAIKVSKP
ncbi:hypothetical protein [Serratia fonticola]